MSFNSMFMSQIAFWMAWILIPLVMEIIPAVGDFFVLIWKVLFEKKTEELTFFPDITIIIPVYNSEDTLHECIMSVHDGDYPVDHIQLLLVNNGSKDESFRVFTECQQKWPDLSMTWMNSSQGKSRALNLALFASSGKYIINIDSDGILAPDAVMNMIKRFEADTDLNCMTGTIMTNPEEIKHTRSFIKRLFRKIEFFEYAQAFLAGRNFQSVFNSMFTLSGAFSAFRRSTILKTQLYNTDTVGEDTHVTFQIRQILRQRVSICPDAIFFVDPIENIGQLYTQRQRWQRGEIEVMSMFMKRKLKAHHFFSDFTIRLLMFDHTFAFPRMIWYFALIFLAFKSYPMKTVALSILIIYILYTISAFLFYINVMIFLRNKREILKFYVTKFYIAAFLPLYNFVVFWFRFAGMINSISREQTWKTYNFRDERKVFRSVAAKDFGFLGKRIEKARSWINSEKE